jgi:pyridoxal phosphate enzyme (YggS family)
MARNRKLNLWRTSAKLMNMPSISENIARIKTKLGATRLIVVSKFRSIDEIKTAYDSGHRAFAENRVQALLERYEVLPKDIEWHLIGHLQTNKVKYVAPFITLVHSVDSEKLLQEIDRQGEKSERVIDCLLQVYVASEETKFGLEENELMALLENGNWRQFRHIRLCGIMAMASLTDDQNQIHSEFDRARSIFEAVKRKYFSDQDDFRELSIGMSSDFEIALEHGSSMVRIGSKVFESA